MGMETDDIGNGDGKELETTCMEMEIALIPMGINLHRRLVFDDNPVLHRKQQLVKVEYHWAYFL